MLLSFLFYAFANPTASQYIRMGLPRLIVQQSQLTIQKYPDDALSFATLGIGYARLGQYADAQSAFLCSDQSNYENALEYLADSYRYFYDISSAVGIRNSLLWDNQTLDQDRVRIYYDMIEDYRFGNQIENARTTAYELIGFHPRAMLGWAQLANIAMDENNLDEAFMYLEVITRDIQNGRRSPKELIYIQTRFAYLMGEYEEAHTMIQKSFQQQPTHDSLLWLAKAKHALYGPKESLALLERKKFQYNEHPKVLEFKRALYLELEMYEQISQVDDFLQKYAP